MYMNSVLKYISLHKNKRWTINEDIRLVECSPCQLVNNNNNNTEKFLKIDSH